MRARGLVPLLPERADEEERDGLVSLPCSQSAGAWERLPG